MCFQKLQWCRGIHFGGDDAFQIHFGRKQIDGSYFPFVHDEFQNTRENLGLLPFPVETDADGYILQGKRAGFLQRRKGQFVINVPIPENASFVECNVLPVANRTSFGGEVSVQRKRDGQCADNAYAYFRFFHIASV